MNQSDTIFALSSGHGRAGVAVVRLSGDKVRSLIELIAGVKDVAPRAAKLVSFQNPESGSVIDRGLLLFFPGPGSFTGEDVAEFQVHGSRAVLDELYECLAGHTGVRPAEAGEFTRRAFYNGKMDLTGVEGLADLIEAETKAQKDQALAQAGGSLARLYDGWRESLVRASSLVEADIDFADQDLPDDLWHQAGPLISRVAEEIEAHLADGHRGERLREGYRVAVLGAPNIGKSSFVNLLARRDVAIVSDEPGTTRDIVEVHLDLGGFPVIVMDTAGLRETSAAIEKEGIRRARLSADAADLRVWMADARDWPEAGEACEGRQERDLLLWNKIDGTDDETREELKNSRAFGVSALTGAGIGKALKEIAGRAGADLQAYEGQTRGLPGLTRARYRQELELTLVSLKRVLGSSEDLTSMDTDLVAEDLRQAIRSLGRITGRVDVEEILDHIFGAFCIGK